MCVCVSTNIIPNVVANLQSERQFSTTVILYLTTFKKQINVTQQIYYVVLVLLKTTKNDDIKTKTVVDFIFLFYLNLSSKKENLHIPEH